MPRINQGVLIRKTVWENQNSCLKFSLPLRIQSMDYLHAFGHARSQSIRPCYLRSDHDFYISFRRFPINSKKFWGMMSSRWPCHGLSRSVTVCHGVLRQCPRFKYIFCLLLQFVTVRHGLSRFATHKQKHSNQERPIQLITNWTGFSTPQDTNHRGKSHSATFH